MSIEQPEKPQEPEIPPSLAGDPDILAERKKNIIWHLKLARGMELAKAMGFYLQTFKAEAVSLISGIGTLVVGWFQIKKWILTGRKEVRRAEARAAREAEGGGARAFESRRERPAPTATPETGTPVLGHEGAPIAMMPQPHVPTMMTDPGTYVWITLLGAFIGSSIKAWLKKRAARAAQKGA